MTSDVNTVLRTLTRDIITFQNNVKMNSGKVKKEDFEKMRDKIGEGFALLESTLKEKKVKVDKDDAKKAIKAALRLFEDPATIVQVGQLQVNFFITEDIDIQVLVKRIFEKNFKKVERKDSASEL